MESVITYQNNIYCSIVLWEYEVVYYFTSACCIHSNYVIWIQTKTKKNSAHIPNVHYF